MKNLLGPAQLGPSVTLFDGLLLRQLEKKTRACNFNTSWPYQVSERYLILSRNYSVSLCDGFMQIFHELLYAFQEPPNVFEHMIDSH